jgi:hypothetical protein
MIISDKQTTNDENFSTKKGQPKERVNIWLIQRYHLSLAPMLMVRLTQKLQTICQEASDVVHRDSAHLGSDDLFFFFGHDSSLLTAGCSTFFLENSKYWYMSYMAPFYL